MNLQNLRKLFLDAGCQRLLIKNLAPNDNSKNQIYLGKSFDIITYVPTLGFTATKTSSDKILKAKLNFCWLDESGEKYSAPNAQLILYPQYPEVRMSGFLQGCKNAPANLVSARLPNRLLLLGTTSCGSICGFLIHPEDPLRSEILAQGGLEQIGVFLDLPLRRRQQDPKDLLLKKLVDIHNKGWIDSKRLLSDGTPGPCESSNCGGYTLEAEFEIRPNGYSEPDFLGWEIKQHTVPSLDRPMTGVITLMTPEPTKGWYAREGVESFVRKFGYKDKKGREDRWNFGGIHKAGVYNELTNLRLELSGFDITRTGTFDPFGGLQLLNRNDICAAEWTFASLMSIWNRKHAMAAYIPSLKREKPKRQYQYGNKIHLGIGTDFIRFLRTLSNGNVYYDPGIKLENASSQKPAIKRRSQFRIKFTDLSKLYRQFDEVDILASD